MSARYEDLNASDLSEEHTPRDTEVRAGMPGTSALDRLYRLQVGRLLRLFGRRAGQADAPDLVQETFVRFGSASLERGIEPASQERYLTRIAVNVLRDRNKSAPHRASLTAVPLDEIDPPSANPVEMLEARDRLHHVEAVLLRLKPLTREIFIARRFQGWSRSEIAEQTGLGVKAIDKHLAKAVEHLYLHLGERDER